MGTIILTSTGLSNQHIAERFFNLIHDKTSQHVAIVVTAAECKESNKYSKAAFEQFKHAGFSLVDFVDLENQDVNFDKYQIIYVCGGNTFKLLKYAREHNFLDDVKKLLERNGYYIGVSAGSIIMTPSIDVANEIEPDSNETGLSDLRSFNLVSFHIMPHYRPDLENEVKKFEQKYGVEVKRLNDSQALFIDSDKTELVE